MGAINYYTSDYITLAINTDDFYFLQDDFDKIAGILENEHFYYFHIALKPGYYEGFSIDIEFNMGYYFDCYQDKKDAQKEITRVKQFLIDCINEFNLRACSPGWCTKFYDYNESIERLKRAIKEMRETVNNTPTWEKIRRLEIA